MIVTISFDMKIPDDTRAAVLASASERAACAAENVIEASFGDTKGAAAGATRVRIKANRSQPRAR